VLVEHPNLFFDFPVRIHSYSQTLYAERKNSLAPRPRSSAWNGTVIAASSEVIG